MGLIQYFFQDWRAAAMFLLLAMPGRLMALAAHEFAHGWMADKCGDSTARLMGRVTLNPIKHIDPIGLIMMLVAGFGWAKPVPVNPQRYRNYRRDDLLVSIAGITMNLILFLVGAIAMYIFAGIALSQVQHISAASSYFTNAEIYITTIDGAKCVVSGGYYVPISYALTNAAYYSDMLIVPVFGQIAGYAYDMLGYFVLVNLVLAVFNLIPIPPLDGYHVLNYFVLKKPLFASAQAGMVGMMVLLLLAGTDFLTNALSAVQQFAFTHISALVEVIYAAIGIL